MDDQSGWNISISKSITIVQELGLAATAPQVGFDEARSRENGDFIIIMRDHDADGA